ncbi:MULTISPECIES: hypothetical protein [unclassified Viridibacillus]|uniref:hypothetical protein n=1 Tax=unclassified Viridibacillus TaxID=2617942 RepID=UPI00096CA1CE|nr:hypothetical protein [Viridibacillus sp. FSL H8-0123]OMC84725.1 hypothetical protein BK130_03670 [Viridibacillus sp. FSL H8-0123]
MTLSKETKNKINQFVKQNTKLSVSDSKELTYFEELAIQANQTLGEAKKSAAKFKWSSQKNNEAQEELMSYMDDYIQDLMIEEGISEADAFEKAKASFAVENPDNPMLDRNAKWMQYLEPNIEEAIGLYYAAFMFIGLTLGALVGVILQMVVLKESIGLLFFIITGIGLMMGLAFGMLKNAKIRLNSTN